MATKSNHKSNSGVLDFNAILAVGKPKIAIVHIAELGGDIGLKGLSAIDVIEFAASRGEEVDDKGRQHEAMLALVAKSVVDKDGNPIFNTPEKVQELQSLNFKTYTAIAAAVTRNAGLTPDEVVGSADEALEKGKG